MTPSWLFGIPGGAESEITGTSSILQPPTSIVVPPATRVRRLVPGSPAPLIAGASEKASPSASTRSDA